MKKVRNIAVIVLSVICVGILVFLLWNLRSTEESAQEIIPEVQPEPMSEQSVSDSDVSGNSAENSGDPTELPETEESEPAEPVDLVEQKAEELLAGRVKTGDQVTVTLTKDKITFKVKRNELAE